MKNNLTIKIKCNHNKSYFRNKNISALTQFFKITGESMPTPGVIELTISSINKPDLVKLESNVQLTQTVTIDRVSYSVISSQLI